MRKALISIGISNKKIISPIILLQDEWKLRRPDLFAALRENRVLRDVECLIFGLSYSLLGIDKAMLDLPAIDFSYHGLDLYYNYQLYRCCLERDLFQNTNVAFLVFPYYYFDYDMSGSLYQYETGQIFAVKSLDDWHNYKNVLNGNDYVVNYRMFGNKIMAYYQVSRFGSPNYTIHEAEDYSDRLGNTWFASHEETVEENKEIFCQLIRKLQERSICICLVVPPFYMRGLDQDSLRAVAEKKKRFYSILKEIGALDKLQVFDYMELYADKREFFFDTTHLNANGAKVFTEVINAEVIEPLLDIPRSLPDN